MLLRILLATTLSLSAIVALAAEPVKIGLTVPTSGRYKEQGQAQSRGALLAVEQVNASGGIQGRPLELLIANTAAKAERTQQAVQELAAQGAAVIFGATSSEAALAAGAEAARQNLPFIAVQGYDNSLTGAQAQRHFFRETYNAYMAAKALAAYLNDGLQGKKLFYMTADYGWGHSVEESLRRFTGTADQNLHPGVTVTYPRPRYGDFEAALQQAASSGADVLILIQFGEDMASALEMATRMGLKDKMTIVVPNLTLGMARTAGAESMSGVIGAVPWYWQVPYQYDFPRGRKFVEDFVARFGDYPSSAAASAYSVVFQLRDAARRAGSLTTARLISALEGHSYSLLKGEQTWRALDHQNVQSVFVVRGRSREEIVKSPLHADYFEILSELPAADAALPSDDWQALRKAAGKPETLQ